eukprot:TRINITY_DN4667_c0_g1_i1.p1 TRINITY_DN4667_c0_g1~~TRINITY_DN4667_c0_g1_i1.p1  ORF type:complete len:150 (+),score=22.98 TRINITY_DN4667_c0_g1_i1:3-452(+)
MWQGSADDNEESTKKRAMTSGLGVSVKEVFGNWTVLSNDLKDKAIEIAEKTVEAAANSSIVLVASNYSEKIKAKVNDVGAIASKKAVNGAATIAEATAIVTDQVTQTLVDALGEENTEQIMAFTGDVKALLSHLLAPSRSQSSWLMPLH